MPFAGHRTRWRSNTAAGMLVGGWVSVGLLWPAAALAGDPMAGLAKSALCASCHGIVGRSPIPSYPNLAGQNALYFEYALRLYKSGARKGDQAGMMFTVAQPLSEKDIADLAAYYASLE
jgi:cytochrome c553